MRTSIRSDNAVVGYGESVNARVRLAVFLIEPALDDPDAIEIGAARIRQRKRDSETSHKGRAWQAKKNPAQAGFFPEEQKAAPSVRAVMPTR